MKSPPKLIKRQKLSPSENKLDKFIDAFERSPRILQIQKNVQAYMPIDPTFVPTSKMQCAITPSPLTRIDASDRSVKKQLNLLCTVQRLVPPSKQLREQALWFGKFDKERLVTLLGYRMYRLNSSPDSILISIDVAASIDDSHSMSDAITSLLANLRRRRRLCILHTQSADTDVARKFWAGKLTHTARSSVITALLAKFDPFYKIYDDVIDASLIYW